MNSSTSVDVLFLNGWSVGEQFVASLLQDFAGTASYRIVDVDERFLKDAWLETLSESVGENTLIIGWSLGGMLAIRLSYFLQGRKQAYRKLVTLMCAPSFVSREGWCAGMNEKDFASFKKAARSDLVLTKTFPYLMLAPKTGVDVKTDAAPLIDRAVLAQLKERYRTSLQSLDARMSTLSLLEQLDLRKELGALNQQAILIFAEHDQLVSVTSAQLLQELYAQHQVRIVEGETHLLNQSIMDLVRTLCTLIDSLDEAAVGG